MAQVIAGVDTHKDTHYAAVISLNGEHLSAVQFPATKAGTLQGNVTALGRDGPQQ